MMVKSKNNINHRVKEIFKGKNYYGTDFDIHGFAHLRDENNPVGKYYINKKHLCVNYNEIVSYFIGGLIFSGGTVNQAPLDLTSVLESLVGAMILLAIVNLVRRGSVL
jgi:sulfite exporter TauE/SafE